LARLLEREFVGLAALVAVWLVHLSLSFARQRFDTRVFMGLYAQIATYIVGEQQGRGHGTSTISARVEMVRDVVGILRERGSGDLPEHPDDRRLTRDAFVTTSTPVHWRVARSAPGTRMVFSFRSPDYSAPLSSQHQTEPHVRIKAMSDPQVGEFLTHCSPDGPRVLRVGSWRS
jgi:hypothetical protein